MKRSINWNVVVVALSLALVSCVGQRLLTIEVDVDGRVVLDGVRGVRDDMPAEKIRGVIEDEVYLLPVDPPYGELAEQGVREYLLEGDVVVRVRHKDTEFASARLSSLALERVEVAGKDGESARLFWSLSKAEAARVKAAFDE